MTEAQLIRRPAPVRRAVPLLCKDCASRHVCPRPCADHHDDPKWVRGPTSLAKNLHVVVMLTNGRLAPAVRPPATGLYLPFVTFRDNLRSGRLLSLSDYTIVTHATFVSYVIPRMQNVSHN